MRESTVEDRFRFGSLKPTKSDRSRAKQSKDLRRGEACLAFWAARHASPLRVLSSFFSVLEKSDAEPMTVRGADFGLS